MIPKLHQPNSSAISQLKTLPYILKVVISIFNPKKVFLVNAETEITVFKIKIINN